MSKLPYKKARDMVFKNDKNDVHVICGPFDSCWPRSMVLEAIRKYGAELSGHASHGLVIRRYGGEYDLLIETK